MQKLTLLLKNKVEEILRLYPETRDDDRLLYAKYAERFHGVDASIVMNLPVEEHIARKRRFLQAEGKYPASDRCKRRRKHMERKCRSENSLKHKDGQYILNI